MAHLAIINLADRLLNPPQSQTEQNAPAAPQNPQTAGANSRQPPALPATSDQFTPSAQSTASQAAGLFSVATSALFTAAANFLLAAPAATSAATANAASSTTAPATGTTGATQQNALAPTIIPPPTQSQADDASAQLQSLNDSLAALGLSQIDISVIDHIAASLQGLNPTAYTNLIYQPESFAQTSAPPAAQPSAAAPAPPATLAASPGAATAIAVTTTATTATAATNAAIVPAVAAGAASLASTAPSQVTAAPAAALATNPSTAAEVATGNAVGALPKGGNAIGAPSPAPQRLAGSVAASATQTTNINRTNTSTQPGANNPGANLTPQNNPQSAALAPRTKSASA